MAQAVAVPQTLTRSVAASSLPQRLMRGLVFAPSLPRYAATRLLGQYFPARALPLSLAAMPEPLPRGDFQRLRVRLAGLGERDLALLYGRQSPAALATMSFPAVLGHQILAELGGVRVVVNPVLACLERGLPECPACARGDDHLCQSGLEGNFAPGSVGFCSDFPGGFAPLMLAHRERIFPIPETVSDECAVLAEPLAQVVHGLGLAWRFGRGDERGRGRAVENRGGGQGSPASPPVSLSSSSPPASLLIVGGRVLGLLAVKALRVMGYDGRIHVVTRQSRAVELARFLGADAVHPGVQEAQQALGVGRARRGNAQGGFAGVIEASQTAQGVQAAAGATEAGGRVLLLGQTGAGAQDFAPYALRQLSLQGSWGYSWDSFARAVELLPAMHGCDALVTHKFALEAWPEAVRAAATGRGIKVVFKPN